MRDRTVVLAFAAALLFAPVAHAGASEQDKSPSGLLSANGSVSSALGLADAPATPTRVVTDPVSSVAGETLPLTDDGRLDLDTVVDIPDSVQLGPVSLSTHAVAGSDADAAPSDDSLLPSATATAYVAVPVVATASVAVVAGGLAGSTLQARLFGALARGGRLLAGLLPAALFSRLDRGSLLENPVRARVHEAVAQDPGLSLSEVCQRAGIAWGTTVHHLRRLEGHGLIVSVSSLAHRRYFIADTPAARHRGAVAVLIHPTARSIAQVVEARPGIDQTGICQVLGLNNPAASKHLAHFVEQGLVESVRVGRSRQYRPTDAMHASLALLAPVAQVTMHEPMIHAQPQQPVLVAG